MLPKRTPSEVICHGAFAPYNTTFVDGKLHGIIDFDTLHPGPRLWEIAYVVYRWVPFVSPFNSDYRGDLENQICRLKLYVDRYGLSGDARKKLPQMMIDQLQSLVNFMYGLAKPGNEYFPRHIEEGHAKLYLNDLQYLRENKPKIPDGIL